MENNTLFIASKKRVTLKLVQTIVLISLVLAIYCFIRLYLDPSYKPSNGSILGFITAFIWIALTEEGLRKLKFENEKRELIVTKKTLLGKEKQYAINYSKLEYEVKSLNKFLAYFFGKKKLILMNAGFEIAKIKSIEEFNIEEIEKIEKTLMEIKKII